MRLLYFSRDYTPHDHRFLSALARTGHQIGYLRLERRGHTLEQRPLPPGVEAIPWVGGQSPARFRDGFRLLRGLKDVIRSYQPDLIQAGPLQRSAFLVALAGFRPLVSMSWGYDLLIDAQRNRWWRWATEFTLKHSAAFVGDCKTIRDLAISHGMDPDRIVTFPWGVDIDHFSPQNGSKSSIIGERLGWGEDTFVLLSARSWAPLYGVTDLARAFVRVARNVPEMRLLMLGNGPLAPDIHHIFMDAKMIDRVHFPGQVSRDDLPAYYRAADLYISTSHSDGTSISLLEALACATPVLLSDIPGNREWVTEPGQVGWLFRDGDVDSLSDGIFHAWESRSQLPAMGQAARMMAESRADWDQNFPQLFEAYQIALNRR